ncbi:MAG: 3-ketoacyl-ACP reductase [Alphaproteobacteria bacterium 16-39-46]|nr:MAG: 3-ketoacyl-ACP reductase [Alphaproteobacteria bacterium 16-39-46]OZA41280.1 MAG: 3-ketoacyl-ACP reductase [Alphaproteobacteria bacterium 17-39-52]HQS84822.1 SDR family oxidoreductase [Alphaproteobacteria bacterium]HQS94616.1 SDR family oxidoreductase [Alphaproteobacteria bacterium]
MQFFDLKNKTALITGASSGLGEQFARILSAAGARVILSGRRLDKLTALVQDLKNAYPLEMDVASKSSVQRAFETLETKGEKIDICINNAGIALETSLFDSDDQNNFENILKTNVMGVWHVTKAVANHMKKNNIQGSIINIGSVNGDRVPALHGAAYSLSKAAVIHLTKTLVGELAPLKIRINCISPGWIKTPMLGSNAHKVIPHIPYGDIPEPDSLDGLILYLASNKASKYVQGACFTIDGGISWGGKSWGD